MKTGEEWKSEWGEQVIIIRASKVLDVVYFIDELYFIDYMPIEAFNERFKPTGRINTALKNLFNEKNFREGNENGTGTNNS